MDIYTDASTPNASSARRQSKVYDEEFKKNNPFSAAGFIIVNNNDEVISQKVSHIKSTDIFTAELFGIYMAINQCPLNTEDTVNIYTDSILALEHLESFFTDKSFKKENQLRNKLLSLISFEVVRHSKLKFRFLYIKAHRKFENLNEPQGLNHQIDQIVKQHRFAINDMTNAPISIEANAVEKFHALGGYSYDFNKRISFKYPKPVQTPIKVAHNIRPIDTSDKQKKIV